MSSSPDFGSGGKSFNYLCREALLSKAISPIPAWTGLPGITVTRNPRFLTKSMMPFLAKWIHTVGRATEQSVRRWGDWWFCCRLLLQLQPGKLTGLPRPSCGTSSQTAHTPELLFPSTFTLFIQVSVLKMGTSLIQVWNSVVWDPSTHPVLLEVFQDDAHETTSHNICQTAVLRSVHCRLRSFYKLILSPSYCIINKVHHKHTVKKLSFQNNTCVHLQPLDLM